MPVNKTEIKQNFKLHEHVDEEERGIVQKMLNDVNKHFDKHND